MRKWVRIAAAVLLLLVVFLVPWSETEIHKMRCRSAWGSVNGSMVQRLKEATYKLVGATPPTWESESGAWWRLHETRQALVEVGFLIRERVELKNGAVNVEGAIYGERPEHAFWWVEWHHFSPNIVFITAPRSEIAAVSNLVRRIDERGK